MASGYNPQMIKNINFVANTPDTYQTITWINIMVECR